MAHELIDIEDGENLAVRAFLLLYGGACGVQVGVMRDHLTLSGYPGHWPEWAAKATPGTHITKGGAQSWLRYLFSLEKTNGQED